MKWHHKIIQKLNVIWDNYYCRITIYVALSTILFLLILFFGLALFTRQWSYIAVPDVESFNKVEAQKILSDEGLELQIFDSVYIKYLPKGVIVSQHPQAGTFVKHGRKIFITVNALTTKKEHVPNVIGMSLRQAKLTLESKDFEIGKLSFIPDIATNYVLRQTYKGNPVTSHSKPLPVGTAIDLVVGRSSSAATRSIPNLIGLTIDKAKSRIIENSLNVGTIRYGSSVKTYKDSINAKIVIQNPAYSVEGKLEYGAPINLKADL